MFEYISLTVITFNAIWISIDVDMNRAAALNNPEHPVFVVAENLFCTFFAGEWIIRFLAFRKKSTALTDGWFVFDSVLVALMVLETWFFSLLLAVSSAGLNNTSVLKILRLSRLTRMARMAKLLRAMPELLILIKGIGVASRSVFYTLCLLAVVIYVFAVAFRQLTDNMEIGGKYFSSVPASMASLLLYGALPDMAVLIEDIAAEHIVLGILIVIFILLASLTVLNMLVGVLVEVVGVVSLVEKEQMTVDFVKSRLVSMLESTGLDSDADLHISKEEFKNLLLIPEAALAIKEVGVDPVNLVDVVEDIFKDTEENGCLSFGELIHLMLQFRGSNACTVKDLVDIRKCVLHELHELRFKLDRLTSNTKVIMVACQATSTFCRDVLSKESVRSAVRVPSSPRGLRHLGNGKI